MNTNSPVFWNQLRTCPTGSELSQTAVAEISRSVRILSKMSHSLPPAVHYVSYLDKSHLPRAVSRLTASNLSSWGRSAATARDVLPVGPASPRTRRRAEERPPQPLPSCWHLWPSLLASLRWQKADGGARGKNGDETRLPRDRDRAGTALRRGPTPWRGVAHCPLDVGGTAGSGSHCSPRRGCGPSPSSAGSQTLGPAMVFTPP